MTLQHLPRCVAAIACVIALSASANATILTFDGFGSNGDLPQDFGSNVAANGTGFNTSNGATPDVSLLWGTRDPGIGITDTAFVLLPNRLEFHNAGAWDVLNAAAPAGVVQMDLDSSGQGLDANDNPIFPGNAFIRFSVPAGIALQLNTLDVQQANDQAVGDDVTYTFRIYNGETGVEVKTIDGTPAAPTVNPLAAGEFILGVPLNFTGLAGVAYVLEIDDNRDEGNVRGGLDNISFNQVAVAVPEPTSMAFLAVTGAGLVARRRRAKKSAK